jgi:hypothetical protein
MMPLHHSFEELDELVRAYWEHYRLLHSKAREDRLRFENLFWAWEAVEQMARDIEGSEFTRAVDPRAKESVESVLRVADEQGLHLDSLAVIVRLAD